MSAMFRSLLAAVLLAAPSARADDVAIGAAVGAGGQGDAGYGALELRLDGEWRGIRIGLGGRAVWEGGAFRTREWSRPVDAIAVIRQLEAHAGPVALAAGALAPSTVGHVTDGYRVALDDRARTGVRAVLVTRGLERARRRGDGRDDRDDRSAIDLDASAEIDDVLDPALVGGALAWQVVPAWGLRAATAVDPSTNRVALEAGIARRWERDDARVDVGASLLGERWVSGPALGPTERGLGVVGFASASLDRAGARGTMTRWAIAADIRAGNGSNGAAFGPLYRAERAAILDDTRAGIGGGLQGSVTSARGWFAIGGRYRPGLGSLGTISAGAPMGQRLQAGAWLAASPRVMAGAAEVRAAWATHFYTSLQMARMYIENDSMTAMERSSLVPAWSATVWFGASTR